MNRALLYLSRLTSYQSIIKQVSMINQVLTTNLQEGQPQRIAVKKERSGRWTSSQAYLFESLLERYGKNWKRIHEHMKGRSLSQIRSHGQKHFDKIGAKKVEEFARRAKLIQAYETLQQEKQFQQEASKSQIQEQLKAPLDIIKEEESPVTDLQNTESSPLKSQAPLDNKPSEIIKEQVKSDQIIKEYETTKNENEGVTWFYNQYDGGFLINLIRLHPETFMNYGIVGLIDNSQFRVEASQLSE